MAFCNATTTPCGVGFALQQNWIVTIFSTRPPRLTVRGDISVSGKPLTANCRLAMTLELSISVSP
ncbi:MAG: hypothetical protein J6T41_01070 [Neisseriaceae bacterium]|nr:hypothetical protein [Neisseriaceae bacterium]